MPTDSIQRHEFEADIGFRLYRGNVSLYLQSLSSGRALTRVKQASFAKATHDYLDATGGVGGSTPAAARPTTITDFPDRSGTPIYKFVPKHDWDAYWSKGSVRISPVQYYRQIEKAESQDQREGRAFLLLEHETGHLNLGLSSGLNIGVFCGTSRAASGLAKMRERFGNVHVKIKDEKAFTALIAKHIGATRTWTRDVIYSDSMAMRDAFDHSDLSQFLKTRCSGSLTDEGLEAINRKLFDVMYERGLFPSVFIKAPDPYAFERERRIAFEMQADLTGPKIVTDPALRELVEAIE